MYSEPGQRSKMERLNLWKGSKYVKLWLNSALWQGSEYGSQQRFTGFYISLRFWIWKSSKYDKLRNARVTQGPEYAWITLNITEYAKIYLKNLRWICQNSQCLLQCLTKGHCTNYWAVIETDVFRILSNILEETFCQKNNAWTQLWNQKFFRARGGGGGRGL